MRVLDCCLGLIDNYMYETEMGDHNGT